MSRGLRRGVSLEVIVEEDDNDDVIVPPSPFTSDGDINTSDSNSSSPTPSGWEEDSSTGEETSERKKKKKYRHYWPSDRNLSRARSVSCEALTVLDAGDLETCEAEWNESGDEGLGRPVCVTFSGPISRRRILKARQSINDDPDDVETKKEIEDNIYYQETLELYDNVQTLREKHDETERKLQEEGNDHEEEGDIDEHESTYVNHDELNGFDIPEIIVEDTHEQSHFEEFDPSEQPSPTPVSIPDQSFTDSTTEFEEIEGYIDDQDEKDNTEQDELEELQLEKEHVHEEEHDHQDHDLHEENIHREDDNQNENNSHEDYTEHVDEIQNCEINAEDKINYNEDAQSERFNEESDMTKTDNVQIIIENKSFQSSHIDKEIAHNKERDTLKEKREAYIIRNKEVCLEELPPPHTVSLFKNLFEDLSSGKQFQSYRSSGRFREIRSNPSSKILRFDRHQTEASSNKNDRSKSPVKKSTPHQIKSHILDQIKNKQNIKTQPIEKIQQKPSSKRAQKTENHIPLRKPKVVSGFNIKKALQENPRDYHINFYNSNRQASSKKTSMVSTTNTNYHKFNKLPKGIKNRDRDDVDSQLSDTSEDSGVSNEFSGSPHGCPYGTRPHQRHSLVDDEDPSFKWIDPSVLARIRAVGTTVIFFGPRHQKTQHLPEITPHLQSKNVHLQQHMPSSGKHVTFAPIPDTGKCSSANTSPRVVAVVHKRNHGLKGLDRHFLEDNELESNGTMAVTWRGKGNNTTVYNFTKKQPPNVQHLPEIA